MQPDKRYRHFKTASVLLLLLSYILAPNLLQAEQEWECFRDDHDIQVYSRSVEGCSENEFKATTTIDQPLEVIGSVVMDVPSYKKWVDKCETVMTLHEPGPLHQIVYFSVNAPWPISDRDVIYNIRTTVDQKLGKMTVKAIALKDFLVPQNEEYVRITDASYITTLERISPTKTKVTYICRVNVAGNLYTFAANLISGNIIYNSVKNLKDIAPEYQYSKIVDRYRHYFVEIKNHNSKHQRTAPVSYSYVSFE